MNNPRADMDSVLDEGIRTAIFFLEKNSEFFPFAVALSRQGEIRHVQGYTGEEQPASPKVIELLQRGLKADASSGFIMCCGVITDVRLRHRDTGESSDAIRVEIEHAAANPVTCYLSYHLEAGKVVHGDITAEFGETVIMATSK
jgi:hypothetical protein